MKLPHTLFALPFALVGMLGASHIAPITPATVLWIVVAFSAARFAAMGFNRIVDRGFDAENPRTARREIPTGTIRVGAARVAVVVASALFVVASRMLNPLCFYLSPIALFWVLGYSYTKRFTVWPHLWLGLGLGIAPVGGWLAVTGAW
ncbi:MAG: UbiA family prenyltransferase, partial [Gemmatimonadota bacterium]